MKRIIILVILVALLVQPALALIPVAQAQGPDGEGEPASGGVPGYPAPAKPIPHHEPGQPSRAGSYRTQVVRENELGVMEEVQLSGVDAMVADGLDPLAGNYTLVNWDQILLSWYNVPNNWLDWQSLTYQYQNETFDEDSEPHVEDNVDDSFSYNDITAADLNGDGQAEKIIVYLEEGESSSQDNLIIQTSEMKGYPRATSAPAAVAHSDGRIDLVVRGYDDALWHHDGSTWNNQSATNSPALLSGPAMAARGAGAFDVFVIGPDNQIYRGSFDGSTWSGWILIDGQDIWPALDAWCGPTSELPAPAVVARGNKLDLFRLGPDNTLRWLHSEDGSTWGAWQNLGGMISTGLGVVSQNEDHMQVYARGVDESLWYLTYDNGGWGSWQRVTETMDGGVTIASAPAVLSPDEIYVRGSDNHLWRYDGSGWTDLGGELASGVAVTTGSPKLFALKHDGSLQSDDGTGWSDFGRLPYGPARHELLSGAYLRTPDKFWQEPENIWVDVETGNFLGNCRRQVVVGVQSEKYGMLPRLGYIAVYEIGAGFVPVLIAQLDQEQLIVDAEYPPRITAADVDGDGTDEIAVVYVKREEEPLNELPGRFYMLDIFDIEYEGGRWKLKSLLDGPYQYDGIIEEPPPVVDAGFAGTLQIASGDINGDGRDEVAVISDWVDRTSSPRWGVDDYWIRFRIIYYDPASVQTYEESFHAEWVDGFASDFSEAFLTGVALAAGDVDGDGKDEFVRTWPADCNGDGGAFGYWPDMERGLDVIQWEGTTEPVVERTCAMDDGIVNTPDAIVYTYLDRLAVGDVDLDLEDEVVLYGYRPDLDRVDPAYLEVFNYYLDQDPPPDPPPYLVSEAFHRWPWWIPWESVSKTGLALGPLRGESIRVGRPSYRRQYDVGRVIAVINAPPKHQDILKGVAYDLNASDNETKAQLEQVEGQSTEVSVTTKKEWGVDTSFSLTIGDPDATHTTASLEASYGQNFDKTEGWKRDLNFNQTLDASNDDVLYYTRTDYDVWEYPAYNKMTNEPQGYLTVVWPASELRPTVQPANTCDTWYGPSHQLMNVWSYPAEMTQLLDRVADGEKDIYSFPVYGVGVDDIDFSLSFGNVQLAVREHGYNLGFAAGFEQQIGGEEVTFSLEVVEFTTRLPSFRFSTRAAYDYEKLAKWTTNTTEHTKLYGYFKAIPDAGSEGFGYQVQPYAYWSTGDYLVMDYLTTGLDGKFWATGYDKPDPGFILPYTDGRCDHLSKAMVWNTHDINFDPPIAQIGETVTISATVHNFSNQPASNIMVAFYQGDPEAGGVWIDNSSQFDLAARGVQEVSIPWQATGSGDQHIYAVIDPQNQIDEVHDETDPYVNNNKAYEVLRVAAFDMIDMGLASEQPYSSIDYSLGSTLPLSLYVPPGNLPETQRFELRDADSRLVPAVGKPFEVTTYQGSEGWEEPQPDFDLTPGPNDPPAVIGLAYSDADIAGRNEADLKLYRLWGSYGMEATCPGYQIHRFPADNLLLVPICQGGIFAFLDTAPERPPIYLPLIFRGSP